MKYLFSFLLLFIFTASDAATVYKQTDENGNITYSDIPEKNANVMVIPETQTTPSPTTQNTPTVNSTTPNTTTVNSAEPERKPYTSFSIASPTDQVTFQNQRQIPVNIQLEPQLQEGDKIQLYVDGNPYGEPVASAQLQVNQLDRGTHTLSAVLLDKKKTVVKTSKTITIYIQYARLGPNNPSAPR